MLTSIFDRYTLSKRRSKSAMENIYIVVIRHKETEPWQEKVNGVFHDKRLADNFIEILNAQGFAKFIGLVEGPIIVAADVAAQEALGVF
jgi:hypothetical protein